MDAAQLQEASKRTDVVSYSLLAEINNFHNEQISELNKIFKSFLTKQIEFHQNVRLICNLMRTNIYNFNFNFNFL